MSRKAEQLVREGSTAKGDLRDLMEILAGAMNSETGECWLSVKNIAVQAGVSERTAQYRLRQLEDLGEIAAYPKSGWNGTTVYVLGPLYAGVQDFAPNLISLTPNSSEEEVLNTRSDRVQESAPPIYEDPPITTCPRCGGWYYSEWDGNPKITELCGTHCKDWT